MHVFWTKGYSATSVEDLVEATGVNRYGLYDVWESKHGLFVAALEHYHRTVITESIRELEQPGAGLGAIHTVFDRILARTRTGNAQRGCLLCNTAEEVSPFDAESARVVSAFQRRLEQGFTKAIRSAQAAGDVPRDGDPTELGRYLAGLIQGASYLARSPAGPKRIADFVRVGLRVLE